MPTPARERHRPEHSVLRPVVREHLEVFLARAQDHNGMPLSVEKALRCMEDAHPTVSSGPGWHGT
jgi:hypothetical protein